MRHERVAIGLHDRRARTIGGGRGRRQRQRERQEYSRRQLFPGDTAGDCFIVRWHAHGHNRVTGARLHLHVCCCRRRLCRHRRSLRRSQRVGYGADRRLRRQRADRSGLGAGQRRRLADARRWCARRNRRATYSGRSDVRAGLSRSLSRGWRRCRSGSACVTARAPFSISDRRCGSGRTRRSRRHGGRSGRGAARRRRRRTGRRRHEVLSDLITRTKHSWFTGVTYTFATCGKNRTPSSPRTQRTTPLHLKLFRF